MTIKRILLPLPGTAEYSGEIDTALSAAKAFGAHVEALFITEPPPPQIHRSRIGEVGYGAATAQQVNWAAEERERVAREARDRFAYACAASSIPIRAANEEAGALPAASWREADGTYVAAAVARAPAFDLVVACERRRDGIARGYRGAVAATDASSGAVGAGAVAGCAYRDGHDCLGREPRMLARGLSRHPVPAVGQGGGSRERRSAR